MAERRPRAVLLFTCEHGGNRIPPAYRHLFTGQRARLASHQGLDIGALRCARALSAALRAPLMYADVSRLLVDLNRSPGNPARFSGFTRALPVAMREDILARHYHPYREHVEQWIAARVRAGRTVLHVSVHSFCPVLNGQTRTADVGLLYDPERGLETRLCRTWQSAVRGASGLRVRRNYPYRGVNDGFTRALRSRFPDAAYAGVELELNQAILSPRPPAALANWLAGGLHVARMSI